MTASKRHHDILGVGATADRAQIKAAFRKLARRYHPDLSTEKNAKEKFIEIVEAYRALTAEADIAAHWRSAENARTAQTHAAAPEPGKDCHVDAYLSVEELYWGIELKIDPVGACPGRRTSKGWHNAALLKVNIPRGARPGSRLRLRGKGKRGDNGGAAGDLYVTLKLKPHERYDISDENIYVDLPLSRWEAQNGAIVDVVTPGGRIEVDIPAGIASGQSIRVPKRGLPRSDSDFGDLFAVARLVDVDTRAKNSHKWPHIPHAHTTRWRPTGQRQGNVVDIRV